MPETNPINEISLSQPDPDLPVFLKLSSELTGFSEEDLEGTGMLETYYCVLMKEEDQDGIRAFFERARQILSGSDVDEAIRAALVGPEKKPSQPPTPYEQQPFGGLAQRIILMWYMGLWTTMNGKEMLSEEARTAMVSAQAYIEGLIWTAAKTHPAGAKQPGYASWAEIPLEVKLRERP